MSWNPSPANPPQGQATYGAAEGTRVPSAAIQAALLMQSFAWMFAGLLLTAVVAFFVQGNQTLLDLTGQFYFLLLIGQLALSWGISLGIGRISATVALGLFFVFAASLGFTIGLIVSYYTTASVATAFLSASAMFGGAAIYGAVTKRSLANMSGFLAMAVIGLFVASIVNLFLSSGPIGFIISVVGVVLFTVLTAFHVQAIQRGDYVVATGSVEKAAVIGALSLYISFINIFLFLLRIFGGRE
jgi:FtsH-binding integral membrane protein